MSHIREPLPMAEEPAGSCGLDETAYRKRVDEWRGLLSADEGHREGTGFLWRLPGDRSKELQRLVKAEPACCSFLRLTVGRHQDRVLLRVGIDPRRHPAPGSRAEEAARLLGALP